MKKKKNIQKKKEKNEIFMRSKKKKRWTHSFLMFLGPVVLYTQYCYKVWQYESAAKNKMVLFPNVFLFIIEINYNEKKKIIFWEKYDCYYYAYFEIMTGPKDD